MRHNSLAPSLLAAVLLPLGVYAASPARGNDTAVTLYSSQQPGGIPAEFYRPLPGEAVPAASAVPGFALVRLDRDVRIEAGRSTLRFADVAALIDPTTVTSPCRTIRVRACWSRTSSSTW